MVFRLFVEKKRGFEAQAKNSLNLIKNFVSLESNTELRLFDRYDFENITKEEFDNITENLIVDKTCESYFVDYLPLTSEWRSFAVELNDGKFLEKLNNLKQFSRLFGITGKVRVKYARVLAFSNLLSDYKLSEIENFVVDRRIFNVSSGAKPLSLPIEQFNFGTTNVDADFLNKNDIEIYQFLSKTSLRMSKETLCLIRDYFKILKRNPTLVELYVIDAYLQANNMPKDVRFSEINFENPNGISPLKITLEEFINMREQSNSEKNGSVSLNEIVTAGYDYLKNKGQIQDVIVEGDNLLIQIPADINGVVEQSLISFKAEKINKHQDIELNLEEANNAFLPYQSYCLDTRPSITDNDILSSVGGYSNTIVADDIIDRKAKFNKKMGVATSLGGQLFSKYIKKPAAFSSTAFFATKPEYKTDVNPDDVIIMLGSKMRSTDFSTKDFSQNFDYLQKERIIQFFKETKNTTYIKKVLDFKDGIIAGIVSAFSGVEIDINRMIDSKYLIYTHIALCSKNFRSAVVVNKNYIQNVKEVCAKLGLSSHIIGSVKDEPYIVIKNGKKQLANLSTDFVYKLNQKTPTKVVINDTSDKQVLEGSSFALQNKSIKEAFISTLKNVSISSIKGIASKFDSSMSSGCVLAPFGGKNEITPTNAFVSKIPTDTGNTSTVTAISYGCNPKIASISPYHAAAFSIMECISKIVATGANSISTKLAICNSISNPSGFESKYSSLFSFAFGALSAQTGMNIPAVSYDLSFEDKYDNIFDFACFALAPARTDEIISPEFKQANSTIILIPMPVVKKTGLPDFDKAKVMYRQIHYLSQNGKVLSAGVVNEGGIAATVSKMSFGNSIGVEFENLDKDTLFSSKIASIVIETTSPGAFSGMDTVVIGKTISEPQFVFEDDILSIKDALHAYTSNMQNVYPTRNSKKVAMAKIPEFSAKEPKFANVKVAKPKVTIPVFSSYSSANDLKMAFQNLDASVQIKCINPKDIKSTVKSFARELEDTQILCLPAGVDSAFVKNFALQIIGSDIIKHSIDNLLSNDGLIIGFEQGFDILLDAGLLIKDINEKKKCAYLTQNLNATNCTGFARTKVVSNSSPWLNYCEPSDVFISAIQGENLRFVADESTIVELIKNNQIVSQFVDFNNKPASKMPHNPVGSICGIESICSADGKVLGKLTQPFRKTRGCFVNIEDSKDQRIFEAGINYFK